MKQLLLILLLFTFGLNAYSQNIYFNFTDGTHQKFVLDDIQNITYFGNDMNLNLKNGTIKTWNVLEIESYNYKAFSTTSIQEVFNEVNFYPNPIEDKLFLSFNTKLEKDISLVLLDVNAKILSTLHKKVNGNQIEIDLTTQIKNLSKGIYFIKMTSGTVSITKKIIKN